MKTTSSMIKVIIEDMSGNDTKLELQTCKCDELIIELKKQINISFDHIDLFHEQKCLTYTPKKFNSFEITNDMTIHMIVSNKPLRILDSTIIRLNENFINENNDFAEVKNCWDIVKMEKKFGNIEEWDVSFVTNMSYAFYNNFSFNKDISDWNVENVNDMTNMFYGASSLTDQYRISIC